MSLPINSSNIDGLFGTLYNDPFSNSTNNLVDKRFNKLYNSSLDISLYPPPGLDPSAKPYNGSSTKSYSGSSAKSFTPNFNLPPLPSKPYMTNVDTSRYIPPGLKPEQLDNELESLASDLESSSSLFTFDEQFKNDNLIMEAPLPLKRSMCHHLDTCNNSSCEFTHSKIWYKKQNHFLRILYENKKEIDMILKFRIRTFPKLMPIYTEQLSYHNKLADLAKHFANVTKNDESYLTLDLDSRKQPKKYNEGNAYKNQNEYGDYKGDYNPSKRNYVTNYSKPPASNSSDRWTKAFGNS